MAKLAAAQTGSHNGDPMTIAQSLGYAMEATFESTLPELRDADPKAFANSLRCTTAATSQPTSLPRSPEMEAEQLCRSEAAKVSGHLKQALGRRTADQLLGDGLADPHAMIAALNKAMGLHGDKSVCATIGHLLDHVPYMKTAKSAQKDEQLIGLKFVRYFSAEILGKGKLDKAKSTELHGLAEVVCDLLNPPQGMDKAPAIDQNGHSHRLGVEIQNASATFLDKGPQRLHRNSGKARYVVAPAHLGMLVSAPALILARGVKRLTKQEKNVSEALKILKEALKPLPDGKGLDDGVMSKLHGLLHILDNGKHLRDLMKVVKQKASREQRADLDTRLGQKGLSVHTAWGGSVVDAIERKMGHQRSA